MGFRKNLKEHRLHRGLNQVQLAKELGIAKSTYNEIEHGKHNPSWGLQQRLEQFFGIPASELLAEREEETN